MRRGFKSWSESTSQEYRDAVGIALDEPLDPRQLARLLGVTVWEPADIPGLSNASLEQLIAIDASSWSAVTLREGSTQLIIVNSGHAQTRQVSSVSHELAHLILNHQPREAAVSKEGYLFSDCFDQDQEDEADWLAGSLLVPRDGLRSVYRRKRAPRELAEHFGVSEALLNWRLRMTGVAIQARRAAERRGDTSQRKR